LVWLLLASPLRAESPDGLGVFYQPYRADQVEVLQGGETPQIRLLPPQSADAWPDPVREDLEERVRNEWDGGQAYGALKAGVGLWLEYPLVTARVQDQVLVPVVEDTEVRIRGELALSGESKRKRVVLLIDASWSTNADTLFHTQDGDTARISVLEATRRALKHTAGFLNRDDLELGAIVFGERTWPILEPGASAEELYGALERLQRDLPRGEGRTDLACALWLAYDWLADTHSSVTREIVLLTDGDLPYSGRFLDCGSARKRGAKAEAECEERRNRTPCPASRVLDGLTASSDLVQLSAFARQAYGHVTVYTLLFAPERPARGYRELALLTGGEAVGVSSAQAIEQMLKAVVSSRIDSVVAYNQRTGDTTGNLLQPGTLTFDGPLPLLPGANDVELRIGSALGTMGVFRFRIHAAKAHMQQYLSKLKKRNDELEEELRRIVHEGGELKLSEGNRQLQIEIEGSAF
jgi:hypothetical protein